MPLPQIQVFKEGSSMARFLVSRLSPAQNDTMDDIASYNPGFHELPVDTQRAILRKFPKTDRESFAQFTRRLILG
jgi:hypothetical protein